MGAERRAKPPRPANPQRAARERQRTQQRSERQRRRAEVRSERAARHAAARAARQAKRRRRKALRRARFLRNVVLLETGLRRLGRVIVPAHTRRLPRGKAILVLALNIAPFPGLGTVIYGKWERGIVQLLLTFVFLIGWVWAIADGVRIVHKAFSPPAPPAARLPAEHRAPAPQR